MPTILISGAGSGIGHTFLDHFAKDSSNTIHAIDVSFPDEVTDHKAHAKLIKHTIDTSSESSIKELSSSLNSQPIDLFIHSAAVRGLVAQASQDDPSKAETMEVMDPDTMMKTLQINVLGSFLLIRALIPNLKAAKEGKVVIMGSRMGSMGANKDGGAYAYRASKSGLNALIKSFALDVTDISFIIIHPGRVESRMTPVREEGAVDAEQAIEEMLELLKKLGKKDSGNFYTREGDQIPW
ncbi:MAG: hypothetical protein M1827_005738 [Pycnora praestabilis]|nr:MAG: hypothetical protein M1827_005738 [Pycnora praestabilis]